MNTVREISIKMPDASDKLAELCGLLGDNGVTIVGLCVVAELEDNALRLIVDDPDKALNVLKSFGYTVREKRVAAVEIPEHFGGLHAVLKLLRLAQITVEYLYGVQNVASGTVVVLGLDDVEKGVEVLKRNWVRCYGEELHRM